MSTPTLLDRARALTTMATAMSPAPWSPRDGYEQGERGNYITDASGQIVAAEHDCTLRTEDRDGITPARNAAPDLAAFAVAFAEALPGLRRPHFELCDAMLPPELRMPARCNCGIAAHTDRLAHLAALLGIGLDGKPLAP